MHKATGISDAKIILIGEHAVVYHQPAIALPIHSLQEKAVLTPRPDRQQNIHSKFYNGTLQQASTTRFAGIALLLRRLLTLFDAKGQGFDLTISSALPPERGMGSSAATAVACIRAMYAAFDAPLEKARLLAWADVSEHVFHGNPSGLDAATVSAANPLWFVRGHEPQPIHFPTAGSLVIADTGTPGQTKNAVAAVAQKLTADPAAYQPRITAIGQAVRQAALALSDNDLMALGRQLNAAQANLFALGVSSGDLDRLIQAANAAGSLGSKLTGSGQGGCMIALAQDHPAAEKIVLALKNAHAAATWIHDFAESEG